MIVSRICLARAIRAVLLAAIFFDSSARGVESSGTVGGRKLTLTGVLRIGTTNRVCMVPGLNNHESFPNILEEGTSFGGLEVKKATFHPAEVTFEREGETMVLRLPDVGAEKGSGVNVSETVGFKATQMGLRQFLEAYQQLTGKTVVHPAKLPSERVTFFADGTAAEVRAKMDETLQTKGLVVTNLSQKIAAAISKGATVDWPERAEKLQRYKNLGDEIVPLGALKLSEMPFAQFVQIYEMFSKLKVVHEANLPAVNFTLASGSDLTRREVMHAFDALLAVNGYTVEDAGEGQVRLKQVK